MNKRLHNAPPKKRRIIAVTCRLCTVLTLGLCPLPLVAQSPDYLITLQGDTLRGIIYEVDNQVVRLKEKGQGAIRTFTSDEISAYYYDGLFISARFLELPVADRLRKRYFLKERINGALQLFELIKTDDDISQFQYVLGQPEKDTLFPLIGKQAWGVLHLQMMDCDHHKLQKLLGLKQFRYSGSYLREIVHQYNRCKDQDYEAAYHAHKPVLAAGILTGVARNVWYYRAESSRSRLGLNGRLTPHISPTMGLSFSVHFRKRMGFGMELFYDSFEGSRMHQVADIFGTLVRGYLLEVEHHVLRLPLQARYSFSKGAIQPFASFGPSLIFDLSINVVRNSDITRPVQVITSREMNYGLNGGGGVEINLRDRYLLILQSRYQSQSVRAGAARIGFFSGLHFQAGFQQIINPQKGQRI